jgi:hypothetical protein
MAKVTLDETKGPVLPRWSEVSLLHRDGRRWTRRVEVAHGDAADPLTDDELEAKARDCFQMARRGTRVDAVVASVLNAAIDDRTRIAVCLEPIPMDP